MKIKKNIISVLSPYLYKSAYSRSLFMQYRLVYKEIRFSFTQFYTLKHPLFSLIHTGAVILSSITRLFLGRSTRFSFGFTGEDRIIESLLNPLMDYNGSYVDVGCNHPKFLSNTYSLYRRGWKGVCIDPNSQMIRLHQKYRPNDISVCALISDSSRQSSFYFVENNVLSTTGLFLADKYRSEGLIVSEKKFLTVTLTQILDAYKFPYTFDLLCIDAEDHDYEVLSSLDFSRYSPKLIVVEDDSFLFEAVNSNRFCLFMKENGYRLQGAVSDNLYFMKII